MAIPSLRPIVVAGTIVTWGAGALEGDVVVDGLGAFGGLRSPKDSVLKYEAAIKTDKCLRLVHGDGAAVKKAHGLLTTTSSSDVRAHGA